MGLGTEMQIPLEGLTCKITYFLSPYSDERAATLVFSLLLLSHSFSSAVASKNRLHRFQANLKKFLHHLVDRHKLCNLCFCPSQICGSDLALFAVLCLGEDEEEGDDVARWSQYMSDGDDEVGVGNGREEARVAIVLHY